MTAANRIAGQLAAHADADGIVAGLTRAQLAAGARCSERQASYSIRALEAAGLVDTLEPARQHHPPVYRVHSAPTGPVEAGPRRPAGRRPAASTHPRGRDRRRRWRPRWDATNPRALGTNPRARRSCATHPYARGYRRRLDPPVCPSCRADQLAGTPRGAVGGIQGRILGRLATHERHAEAAYRAALGTGTPPGRAGCSCGAGPEAITDDGPPTHGWQSRRCGSCGHLTARRTAHTDAMTWPEPFREAVRLTPCPRCAAGTGEPCHGASAQDRHAVHRARITAWNTAGRPGEPEPGHFQAIGQARRSRGPTAT